MQPTSDAITPTSWRKRKVNSSDPPNILEKAEVLHQTIISYSIFWPNSDVIKCSPFRKILFIQLQPLMLLSDPDKPRAINFILLMEMGIVTSEIKFDTLKIESVLAKCKIQLIFESVLDFLRCIYKVLSGNIEFLHNLLRHLADKFGTSFLQETRMIIYIFFII